MTGSTSAQTSISDAAGFTAAATQTETNPWQRNDGPRTAQRYDGRIEPALDPDRLPPDPAYYAKRAEEAGIYRQASGTRWRRLGLMLGVFVIGASVGLGAAWWLHSPLSGAVPEAAAPASPSQPIVSSGSGKTPLRGIRASELPYDGAVPPAAQAESPPAKVKTPAARRVETPAARVEAPAAKVEAPAANVETPTAQAEPDPSPATAGNDRQSANLSSGAGAAEPDPATTRSRQSAAEEGVRRQTGVPPAPNVTQEVRQGARTGNSSVSAARKSGSGSVAAAPRRRNVARASDREIERIRRQADEELKKKTERGREAGTTVTEAARGEGRGQTVRTTVTRQGASITPALLAQCARAPNFIQREICKWKVCNGKWGTRGCPSYQAQAVAY